MASLKINQAKHRAFLLNGDLMPIDCLDILVETYGKRLDRMMPKTINNMIHQMMQTSTESKAYTELIDELVQEWCNNF